METTPPNVFTAFVASLTPAPLMIAVLSGSTPVADVPAPRLLKDDGVVTPLKFHAAIATTTGVGVGVGEAEGVADGDGVKDAV